MATSGDSAETEITAAQETLLQTLAQMKLTPKADTPQDLKQWMIEYLQSTGDIPLLPVKKEHQELGIGAIPKRTTAGANLPQASADITGQNRTTKTSFSQPPRISNFSGASNKGETTYDLWRYEINCLMKEKIYELDVITHAVRHSLRGEAGRVSMRLGTDATVHQILQKLDSVYGNVARKEELMAEFYSARQQPDEDVSSWSCRLEDIIGKAAERGLVTHQETDAMLHAMLWTGLRSSLKDISAHKYDSIHDFDGLRVALRQIEKDQQLREGISTKKISKAAVIENSEVNEIKTMLKALTEKVNKIEEKQENQRTSNFRQRNRPWNQKQNNSNTNQQKEQKETPQQSGNKNMKDIQCYRCKQYGHIARGCRVRMDHSKNDLNSKRPMERDQQ